MYYRYKPTVRIETELFIIVIVSKMVKITAVDFTKIYISCYRHCYSVE
jgi:hypothetical protein